MFWVSAPPPSGQPYPPPYQGPVYYPPMNLEGFLTKRNLWVLNAVGLLGIFIGFLIYLSGTRDTNFRAFAAFMAFAGGLLGIVSSLAGALGSKRTTDMQNLGLLIWAGFLLSFVAMFVARYLG